MSQGDVVLALSKGGGSQELNLFCQKARSRASGLVVITASPASPLAAVADEVIVLKLPEGGDLGDVIATASSLAAATVTDALVEVVRQARNADWVTILDGHPSGAVGRDAVSTLARLSAKGEKP